jgi:hypothetical protein
MRKTSHTLLTTMATALLVLAGIGVAADTLVLRDGRRIQGQLQAVRGGTIEFDEDLGRRGSRTIRVGREEIARIEFDAPTDPAAPAGGGRPSGMRERQVMVSADVPWNDTGIQVRRGQTVYFSATGRVRWGGSRQHGPAGENNSPFNAGRPMPQRPGAALIGRIGDEDRSDLFFIGGEPGPFQMRGDGRLYLGINDDYIADNSGHFRVIVYY